MRPAAFGSCSANARSCAFSSVSSFSCSNSAIVPAGAPDTVASSILFWTASTSVSSTSNSIPFWFGLISEIPALLLNTTASSWKWCASTFRTEPMALKKGNSAIQFAIQMKVKIVITTGKNRRPFFSPAVLMQMLYSASITASTTFWRPDGIRLIFRVASSATTISTTTTVSDVTYVLTSGKRSDVGDRLGLDLDDRLGAPEEEEANCEQHQRAKDGGQSLRVLQATSSAASSPPALPIAGCPRGCP